MERQNFFEAMLVLTLIGLTGLLAFAIVSTPPASESWEMQANGTIDYMFVGSDDTLYAFSGNTIMAVSGDGRQLWNLTISPEWKVLNDWKIPVYTSAIPLDQGTRIVMKYRTFTNYPVARDSDGHLYVYVVGRPAEDDTQKPVFFSGIQHVSCPVALLAISPGGDIEWQYELPVYVTAVSLLDAADPYYEEMTGPPVIMAQGGRVYLFHDGTEDVLGRDGRFLFDLHNVSSPAAVDEAGRMYMVRGMTSPPVWPADDSVFMGELRGEPGYNALIPSDTIDAYNPDGSLAWSTSIGVNTTGIYVDQSLMPVFSCVPIYANHTLYVPVQQGFAALDTNGGLKWVRQIGGGVKPIDGAKPEGIIYVPLPIMPVDSLGNAYLSPLDCLRMTAYTCMISAEGDITMRGLGDDGGSNSGIFMPYDGLDSIAGKDGIIYAFDNNFPISPTVVNESLASGQIDHGFIVAYDVKRGARLWNFTVPAGDSHVLTLNLGNYRDVLLRAQYIVPIAEDYRYLDTNGQPHEIYPQSTNAQKDVKIYPGRDVIYVSYYYDIYEYPLVINRSRCVYAGGLYALDRDGNLLWERQPDGLVMKSAAGNGAFYYLTNHGKMGGGTAGIAAGAALVSVAYLFLRFFLVGAVARARSRIDKNENRNRVLRYVVGHPGATAVDLSRDIGMNIGTIRYHLFVLSINHRVIYHREDGKYLRYFTNSGTYTPEERIALSLLRREPLRRMLAMLAESPGLTSLELSQRLGVSTTAAHRHINELMDRDIIVKVRGPEKGNVFFIDDRYKDFIIKTLGQAEL
ncbi:MAG: winged helix-turn-helix transcriptional regulator [Methanocella sp.]